jgi:starvation-inducible DNA-binding protein
MNQNQSKARKRRTIEGSREISPNAVSIISLQLKLLLADVFALYIKTKAFHWHMTGPHFRDYHLLLDDHANQILAMTDAIAERSRKLGGTTLRSIADIARNQRIKDNDTDHLSPESMLKELLEDNRGVTTYLRAAQEMCSQFNDFATASLVENWIDEIEGRTWFLREVTRAE